LKELKKTIKDTYEYFDVVDYIWWEYIFNEKSNLILSLMNEDNISKESIYLTKKNAK
jgi:hypothetical protein